MQIVGLTMRWLICDHVHHDKATVYKVRIEKTNNLGSDQVRHEKDIFNTFFQEYKSLFKRVPVQISKHF